jgi:hypothetical protein
LYAARRHVAKVFQLCYKLAALVDHVALLVLNAAPRNATTHRQLCHFPCHWPKASTRSGGGLDANAYKEALLAATLDRDCTFVAELIGLLDCFARRDGPTIERFAVLPIGKVQIIEFELGARRAL